MIERALPRCRQAARIAGAVVDGTDTGADRLHAATCRTCTAAVVRARAFNRSLTSTALEVADAIPDPDSLPRTGRFGWRAGRLALRLATVGGAVIAGLLVATVVGSRIPAPSSPGAFVSASSAVTSLERLDLPCSDAGARVVCESTAAGHAHRVELIEEDGIVVGAIATIANTDDTTLVRRGGDALFSRIAAAVLAPEAAGSAQAWLADAYPTCRAACSAALDGISLSMTSDRTSTSLALRSP